MCAKNNSDRVAEDNHTEHEVFECVGVRKFKHVTKASSERVKIMEVNTMSKLSDKVAQMMGKLEEQLKYLI